MRRLTICAVIAAVLAACADEGGPAADAGADSGIDAPMDAGTPPLSIARAALAVLTPCPPGWREVAGSATAPAVCLPYGESGLEDCGPTEYHLPGTGACRPVTAPCPADGWPAELPEAAVVFARAGAAPGGDGSRAAPVSTLAEAVSLAVVGGAVALAPGTYAPATINRDLALRGACAEVVLSSPDLQPVLRINDATVTIDNLRISGSADGVHARDAVLMVSRVVVDDLSGTGLSMTHAAMEMTAARLHDVRGVGVFVGDGASLSAANTAFTGEARTAVRTNSGIAHVTDSVFSIAGVDSEFYAGSNEGGATIERCALLGAASLLVFSDPTAATLRDVALLGEAGDEADPTASIGVFMGARLVFERALIARARTFVVAAAGAGSEFSATDVVILGVESLPGAVGHGLEFGEEGTAELARVYIEGVRAYALLATDEGTSVTAEDVIIRDTQPGAGGLYGRGLQVQSGAHLQGRRVEVTGSHEVAIVSGGTGAEVVLEDLVVERTRERGCAAVGCPAAGIGVGAYFDGQASVARFRISGNALVGAQLARDGQMDLTMGEVSDNPVGINLQVSGYDITRLTEGVTFRGNGTNLDARELPVPAATAPR